MSSPGSLEDKKTQLLGLAGKYPLVAEQVARQLIREFGLEMYAPMIMEVVKGEVAKALQRGPQAPEAASSAW